MEKLDLGNDIFDSTPIVSQFDRLFKPFYKPEFINLDLGFEIDTNEFLEWLRVENPDFNELGTYKDNVASMCEFSCLFLAMKFCKSPISDRFSIVCGDFGFWEHYWVEYKYNDKVYIIDLTLQQFVPDAPELAISERKYNEQGYRVHFEYIDDGVSFMDYCIDKKAFMFYNIPQMIR